MNCRYNVDLKKVYGVRYKYVGLRLVYKNIYLPNSPIDLTITKSDKLTDLNKR